MEFMTKKQCLAARCCAAWASRWRCRCSTRWRRRRRRSPRPRPPRRRCGCRRSRWCTAPPAHAVRPQQEHVVAGGGRHRVRPAPGALAPLEPFRDYLTIVSNTDVRNAEAFSLPEIGADHFRSSAVFLTQAHPKQTQGSDVLAGTSMDQLYAQQFGQDTAIPVDAAVASRRSISPAAAPTATAASTPTPSAGRRPSSRCR